MGDVDLGELLNAVGPIGVFVLVMLWVLSKNGMLKVILRDEGVDSSSVAMKQLDDLNVRMTSAERQIAILNDRWERR